MWKKFKCSGWTDYKEFVASKDYFANDTNNEQACEHFRKVAEKVENSIIKTPLY